MRHVLPDLSAASEFTRAIVVLGCPAGPEGEPSPALLRRLQRALDLGEQWSDARLVVTGGAVSGDCEAIVMRRWLVRQGIEPDRILLEPTARDTLDNADRVAELLAGRGVDTVTLVTEPYHVARSRALFLRALAHWGVGAQVRVEPAEPGLGRPMTTQLSLEQRVKLFWDTLRLRRRYHRRR